MCILIIIIIFILDSSGVTTHCCRAPLQYISKSLLSPLFKASCQNSGTQLPADANVGPPTRLKGQKTKHLRNGTNK